MLDAPETILGISRTADIDQINAAYRKLAKKHHPDMGGDRLIREAKERPLRFENESPEPATARDPVSEAFKTPLAPTRQFETKPSEDGKKKDAPRESIWSFITRKLPLQDETTYFILVNALDIFLTFLILRNGGIEANPIANYFYELGNIPGMVAFKMVVVAFVCVISQVVALRSIRSAKRLLWFGTIAIGFVVLYSVLLLAGLKGGGAP